MSSTNIFLLDGNLTKDPVLGLTANGTPVARYTVASDYDVREGEGWRRATNYIPVQSFGRQAENDAKYLRRGHAVLVQLEVRSWYKPDQGRGGFNFVATSVRYLGAPKAIPKSVEDAPADEWLRDYDSVGNSSGANG